MNTLLIIATLFVAGFATGYMLGLTEIRKYLPQKAPQDFHSELDYSLRRGYYAELDRQETIV